MLAKIYPSLCPISSALGINPYVFVDVCSDSENVICISHLLKIRRVVTVVHCVLYIIKNTIGLLRTTIQYNQFMNDRCSVDVGDCLEPISPCV